MVRFLNNLAVIVLYFTVALVIMFTWRDYACVFAFGCTAADTEELAYLATGRVLVFLNLLAMLFFVNAGFFRNRQLDSSRLAGPVVVSTVVASLVYFSAKYVLTALVFLTMMAPTFF